MIATCPHCQSGFYITPDLAGKVINCSKCKKQVRAPDRRAGGLSSQAPPGDGIPMAIVAETRGEVEERLKIETEAKQEAEKNLKQALEAKALAEEKAKAESQARAELEEKLKAVAEGGIITDPQVMADIEARLKEETEARAKAESKSAAKADIEKLLQAELEARTKAESQLKAEASAKRKIQAQLEEEIKAKENAEKTAATAKARLREVEASAIFRQPVNLCRGLKRLTFILSPVAAIIAGMIAYNHGYVILSPFDRPVHLPLFEEPVYLPLMTMAFSLAGFVAAWFAYLVAIFIIRGFRQPMVTVPSKRQPPQKKTEEIACAVGHKMWRSS
ncbi:MAG: MJ0042-type zinc finger domain-containing protein [Planctomycetota bacterium]